MTIPFVDWRTGSLHTCRKRCFCNCARPDPVSSQVRREGLKTIRALQFQGYCRVVVGRKWLSLRDLPAVFNRSVADEIFAVFAVFAYLCGLCVKNPMPRATRAPALRCSRSVIRIFTILQRHKTCYSPHPKHQLLKP